MKYLGRGVDDVILVPLTKELTKSAAYLAYGFSGQARVMRLADALQADGLITFYDDVMVSGSQASTVVQTWFGLDPDLPEEAEELADVLTDDDQSRLMDRRVRFRFAYGQQRSLVAFAELIDNIRLGNDVDALQVETDDYRGLAFAEGAADELRAFVRQVGFELLSSTKGTENPAKWTEERCRRDALGYGGHELIGVSYYNCPTGTVTALWKGGMFDGASWLPLFPRRNEPDPLA